MHKEEHFCKANSTVIVQQEGKMGLIFFGSDGGCFYGFAEFTPVAFPPLAMEVISAPSFHVGPGCLDEEI